MAQPPAVAGLMLMLRAAPAPACRYLYWRRALLEYKQLFPDMDGFMDRWVASYCANTSGVQFNGPDFCERIAQPSQFELQDP